MFSIIPLQTSDCKNKYQIRELKSQKKVKMPKKKVLLTIYGFLTPLFPLAQLKNKLHTKKMYIAKKANYVSLFCMKADFRLIEQK